MRRFSVVLFVLALGLPLFGDGMVWPRITSVTPDTGKAAMEYTTAGENLSKAQVAELYLTDGKADIKMEVIAQSKDAIKFKVPGSVKAGRYGLLVLTSDRLQFIEQPVKLTIE